MRRKLDRIPPLLFSVPDGSFLSYAHHSGGGAVGAESAWGWKQKLPSYALSLITKYPEKIELKDSRTSHFSDVRFRYSKWEYSRPFRYREKNPKKELRSQLKLPYKFGGLRLIVFELSLIWEFAQPPHHRPVRRAEKECVSVCEILERQLKIYFNISLLFGAHGRILFVYFIF